MCHYDEPPVFVKCAACGELTDISEPLRLADNQAEGPLLCPVCLGVLADTLVDIIKQTRHIKRKASKQSAKKG